jgi:predicted transcriptional regulator
MNMKTTSPVTLSRRERQIMDVVYELGSSSARTIHEAIPDASSYSAIRALLAILVEKGHLKIEQNGARYLYFPTRPLAEIRQNAAQRLIKTFFSGSTSEAVNALLGSDAKQLSDEELESLSELITLARKKRE